jgi:AsmA protein
VKWFIGLFLTSIVIISLMVIVLLWVPLDKFKPQIEQAVFQATGRTLSLDGKIQLRWFPTIGLELGATRLGNAPGFGETPFAELDQALLRIALTPLLAGFNCAIRE